MRTTKTEKARRATLLVQQGKQCALCREPMPTAFRMLLIEKQNAVVCRACGQFMSVYAASVARGVTPEVLAVFLARPPAAEPTVVDVTEHKKLNPEQMSARLLAAKGELGMTVEEHDHRTGATGPVINPDTGLEWIPPVEPVWRDGRWVQE